MPVLLCMFCNNYHLRHVRCVKSSYVQLMLNFFLYRHALPLKMLTPPKHKWHKAIFSHLHVGGKWVKVELQVFAWISCVFRDDFDVLYSGRWIPCTPRLNAFFCMRQKERWTSEFFLNAFRACEWYIFEIDSSVLSYAVRFPSKMRRKHKVKELITFGYCWIVCVLSGRA